MRCGSALTVALFLVALMSACGGGETRGACVTGYNQYASCRDDVSSRDCTGAYGIDRHYPDKTCKDLGM